MSGATVNRATEATTDRRISEHTMARVVQGLGAAAVTLYVIILIVGQVGGAISNVSQSECTNYNSTSDTCETWDNSSYFSNALGTVDTVTESSFILAAVGLIVLVGGALIAAVRGFGGGGNGGLNGGGGRRM